MELGILRRRRLQPIPASPARDLPPDATAGEPLIRMIDIVKTYHTPAGDFVALAGINAQFWRGEFVSVVGKSGSGKSTLANMITGIDKPTSGRVVVDGTAIHTLSESRMSRWRGRHLGIVFQFYQLLPTLSLLDNTMLPMDFCGMYSPAEREDRAMELLRMVGVADHAHELPGAVSGGQQQSAAIARAIANDPPILVADEPTGNLDTRAADNVFRVFQDLMNAGKTIIMVTHDDALAHRASRLIRLADGKIVSVETLDEAAVRASRHSTMPTHVHANARSKGHSSKLGAAIGMSPLTEGLRA